MMVYNSFKEYLKESVKKKFYDYNIDLIVILNSLINIYQSLDISINKLFKDNFYKK